MQKEKESSNKHRQNVFILSAETFAFDAHSLENLKKNLKKIPNNIFKSEKPRNQKRSSFSEAEGPNGPNVPRLLYKQIHKHLDPLFHDPRNATPEEEGEDSSDTKDTTPTQSANQQPKPPLSPPRREVPQSERQPSSPSRAARMRNVKPILKPKGAPTNTHRRVQFDPLALLLDASLEGEIELVKKVIDKVKFMRSQLKFLMSDIGSKSISSE